MKVSRKNLFFCVALCFLSLGLFISFKHFLSPVTLRELTTDSGFDSDFDGPNDGWFDGFGGGGGSDSDSDFDLDYYIDDDNNYDGESDNGPYLTILLISFVLFLTSIPFVYLYNKHKNGTSFLMSVGYSLAFSVAIFIVLIIGYMAILFFPILCYLFEFFFMKIPYITLPVILALVSFLVVKIVKSRKNHFSFNVKIRNNNVLDESYFKEALVNPSIVSEAYECYLKIQKAWSKNNIEEVRDLLSSELYNMYKSQIETMKKNCQRNEMSDFKFVRGVIREYYESSNQEKFVITLQVLCRDYMVLDLENINLFKNSDFKEKKIFERNFYIKSNSKRINDYTYSLTFLRNKETDLDKCPNCNAKLPFSGRSVKCSYCGSLVERKNTNLVLIDKKMIRQR